MHVARAVLMAVLAEAVALTLAVVRSMGAVALWDLLQDVPKKDYFLTLII